MHHATVVGEHQFEGSRVPRSKRDNSVTRAVRVDGISSCLPTMEAVLIYRGAGYQRLFITI